MKRLLILLTLLMFTLPNCTNTSEDSENIFNNNENNTTQDKTEEEEEIQKEITLTSSKLTNVTIKTPPVKTEYTAGETFDPAGLYLQATYTDTYSDGTQKENIEFIDCETEAVTFTGTDFAAAGTATVTVTYKGKNATFSVKVTEKPTFPTIGNYKITGEDIIISDFSDITVSGSSDAEFNISFLATKQTQLSLLEISNIAKAFPNATITADDKISYTINGGTKRDGKFSPTGATMSKVIIDSEFPDLTAFAIDGKISIDETTDVNTHEEGEPTKIRTITLDNGTTLNITGKYLDIGRNRFEVTNNAVVNLSDDIEITTYNSEISRAHHTYITSDIAKEQFDALGLTTPNFDLAISDENLYNFAHDILDRYDSFDDEKHKVEASTIYDIDGSISGKSLYTDNELNSDVPSLKFSSIKKLGYDVKNTKITGDVTSDTTTDINFTNVVFEGDVSGIDNTGTYEGVIHFQRNPIKELKINNTYMALIKIDKIPTKDKALITGGILDFRDVTVDENSDIGTYLKIGEYNKGRGYFKTEAQENIIEPQIKTLYDEFLGGTYTEDVPEREQYMKTLREIEDAANGKGEYSLEYLIDEGHDTVTRTE